MFWLYKHLLQRITSLLLHWRFLLLPDCVDVGRTTHPLFAIAHRAFYPMALNALDGMLARECNQKTRRGRF